jgi:hypothetical protein
MKSCSRITLFAAASFFCAAGGSALAQGLMAPADQEGSGKQPYMKVVDQKAAIYFSKGKEDLIVSPSFEGPATKFAWVIPVPSIPKVQILKGSLFHELSRAVETGGEGATVVERKVVGAYDVSVLSAKDSRDLMRWLRSHGYNLSERATEPLRYYVDKHWYFVAARIENPDISHGLTTGTLAPLRLTFATRRPVFPARFSSVNPDMFALKIYLLMPTSDIGEGTQAISLISGPTGSEKTARRATIPEAQTDYPTIAQLSGKELQVFVVSEPLMDPANCTADYVWATSLGTALR